MIILKDSSTVELSKTIPIGRLFQHKSRRDIYLYTLELIDFEGCGYNLIKIILMLSDESHKVHNFSPLNIKNNYDLVPDV